MFPPELPENSPRYVVLSYELKHRDGRTSFPLVLVNWSPSSSETGLLTLHASALLDFQTTVRRRLERGIELTTDLSSISSSKSVRQSRYAMARTV
jgi:hypothetical protein